MGSRSEHSRRSPRGIPTRMVDIRRGGILNPENEPGTLISMIFSPIVLVVFMEHFVVKYQQLWGLSSKEQRKLRQIIVETGSN